MRITFSKNEELVKNIRKKLDENHKKYGKRFCPCVIPALYNSENSDDYICMCKEFREQEAGECHCGLYVKTLDE